MEMSFVEEEDVFAVWESVLTRTLREALGVELTTPFPRLRYSEAMERYGVDKPDTRFGLELTSVDEWAAESDFQVFRSVVESGGRVLGLCVPAEHPLSRKQVGALESVVKEYGAKGLAWWKAGEDGGAGPLARFTAEPARAADLMQRLCASAGDTCLFVADTAAVARRALGELRNHLGRELGLIGADDPWRFVWVTHFPMFERDVETGAWSALHHPFTAPEDWDLAGEPGELASRAYDLVLNGWELGSGSIRIHRGDVQARVFELLGISAKDQERKFGFLLEALKYGAPPHGGFALGHSRRLLVRKTSSQVQSTRQCARDLPR
jgi:aspartyl-tRNA synthetase